MKVIGTVLIFLAVMLFTSFIEALAIHLSWHRFFHNLDFFVGFAWASLIYERHSGSLT